MRLFRLTPFARRCTVAAAAVAIVGGVTLPAGAAPTRASSPSKGAATSSITLLRLTLSGTTVTAGRIAAVATSTTKPHQAKLVVTPIDSTVTGPLGQQTVTPSSGSGTVPASPQSVSLPSGLGSVTGPTFAVKAANDASGLLASAALKALGKVTVLTVPIDLRAASLSDVARVTAGRALSQKTLALGGLSLPSLQDLLASLGVDLNALLGKLTQGKLTQLAGLVTSTTTGAVKSANDAVDSAQAAIGSGVPTTVDSAQAALSAATTTLTTAHSTLTTANGAFNTAFAAIPAVSLTALGVPGGTTADQFLALAPATRSAVDALTGADLAGLAAAVSTAEAAVQAAQDAVDQLQALVTALTDLVTAVLNAIAGNNDPLAALGDIKVTTSALAARTPHAVADVSVGTTHVLGALTPLASLTGALGTVTGTLSSVLNSVAGVSFTPPSIEIGKPVKSTSTKGRTRFAAASITGVIVHLPSIKLPAALALAGVPTGVGGFLALGQVSDAAQWTPATASAPAQAPTPSSSPPTSASPLPDTGGRMVVPIAGVLILAAGVLLRRRMSASGPADPAA